jgi:hypothetical protein
MKELRGYMKMFMEDVEEEYDGRPLRNINFCAQKTFGGSLWR